MNTPTIDLPGGGTFSQEDILRMAKDHITVECHSALGDDTPVILDEEIKSMRDIFLLRAGQVLSTYALSENMSIGEAEIVEVPQEIYSAEVVDISFSNGFHMVCSPGTQICTVSEKGIITAGELADNYIDIPILSLLFSTANQQIYITSVNVTSCTKEVKALAVPLYLFISSKGNMLLPQETDQGISFICVIQ